MIKSDVETFWDAISAKVGDTRKWNELRAQEQHTVITSINLLLQVLQIRKES